MYIFYDFETSSKELLGQILTYAFVVTTKDLKIQKEFTGKIKLTRLQLPDIDAILTNRINILDHQKEADLEKDAAKKIFNFLAKIVEDYGYVTLVGYNSNAFDLGFLRNLLIRYGYNPYFDGQIMNLDVFHYVQYLALNNPEKFKWHPHTNEKGFKYYSFKLEHVAQSYELITAKQSHEALEDVLLVIELVKDLGKEFKLKLSQFKPVQLLYTQNKQPDFEAAKQRVLDYPNTDREPEKFKYRYLLKVLGMKKDFILLDMEKYAQSPVQECLIYLNPNKHFFVLEELSADEYLQFKPLIEKARNDFYLLQLTPEKYFESIKKDWDIEYQIHELGFQRIDDLKENLEKFFLNPESYDVILRVLLEKRGEQKDKYLIQLFNRIYLSYHPHPKIEYLHRYLKPRYVTGEKLKNNRDFVSLSAQLTRMNNILADKNSTHETKMLMLALKTYFLNFCKDNQLEF